MPLRLDDDPPPSSALIIDGNPTSRSVLTGHLRDIGVPSVTQTGRVQDARRILEHKRFDVVLCDYHFEHSEMSGQDLLDELRREQLLPFSTVFVMVTSESSYSKVTEAAESALDSYLLKPHSAVSLAARIAEARQRKRALRAIFEAIDAQDHATAAALCQARFERRERYWLYAARIGAELFLRLQRHHEAQRLYAAVVDARALPWARLGIARSQIAAGQVLPARRTLDALLGDMPDHADSYDVLGRVQMEQGELQAAFETYQKAATLTPGSITRLLHAGTLAFYAGQPAEATPLLERACVIGAGSKMFDDHALVLLALMQFDARDSRGLQRTQDHLLRRLERPRGRTPRTERFAALLDALQSLHGKQVARAMGQLRALTEQVGDEDMDMEAACGLLGLWARLNSEQIELDDMPDAVQRIARRFCISRATCDMLIASARATEPATTLVREAHAAIGAMAEKAMGHAVAGAPEQAVEMLLAQGADTRNAKLIELASLVAQRHREKITDVESLSARATQLRQAYCRRGEADAGTRSRRSVGGLSLPG